MVDITVPCGVKVKNVNQFMDLAFGDTYETLPEGAKGRQGRVHKEDGGCPL